MQNQRPGEVLKLKKEEKENTGNNVKFKEMCSNINNLRCLKWSEREEGGEQNK